MGEIRWRDMSTVCTGVHRHHCHGCEVVKFVGARSRTGSVCASGISERKEPLREGGNPPFFRVRECRRLSYSTGLSVVVLSQEESLHGLIVNSSEPNVAHRAGLEGFAWMLNFNLDPRFSD